MPLRHFILALAAFVASAHAADIDIPRSVGGDNGRYYLLDLRRSGGIQTALHKRVGPSGTSHTKTEINCAAKKMRVIAEGEDDPLKMVVMPSKWFNLVEGSSKSGLFNHVCRK